MCISPFSRDIAIVGGCGRVGLPLGLAFSNAGQRVVLYDTNSAAVRRVNGGSIPFEEPGGQKILDATIGTTLVATDDPHDISDCTNVIVVIGTPVDEHLNPDPAAVVRTLEELMKHFVEGQLLILRSTIYPGVTSLIERTLADNGVHVEVAFCPERLAQGKALTELYEIPQIVSARSDEAIERAGKLFSLLSPSIVPLLPEEAELAKLFTNVWRYIKFATANQLFMISNEFGFDYERIRQALVKDYPRAADLPSAGFAAGPCLFKDTMQLASFNNNNFTLGHASMTINEGLPLYVVAKLEDQYELSAMRVGILGMAFKANSDDTRSSLSYKLKRILKFKAAEVLCADPHVKTDPELLPVNEVLERSDLLIIGTPHAMFADLRIDKPVVDIWNLRGNGSRV